MSHYASRDYTRLAKTGFLLGVGLFALGALGEVGGAAALGELAGWEQTVLFDLEVLGVLLGLLSPLVFGIVLPLVE